MSSCASYGRPKVRHADKATARMHAAHLNRTRIWRSQAYKCPNCGYWHAGRIPDRYKLERRLLARDEALVGKLIGALKVVINREGRDPQ